MKLPISLIAIAVLGVLNILFLYEWQHTANLLQKEKASHQADISLFKTTQEQANKNAEQIKQKLVKESKDNAKEADDHYSTLLKQYRASLVRYKANQGVTVGPDYNQRPTPQGGNGPSPSTDVLVSLDDANICAVNTARLQAVQEWATHLPKP